MPKSSPIFAFVVRPDCHFDENIIKQKLYALIVEENGVLAIPA